jgi:biofilm PGA synthesis N-glycosyltransferase PgaC
VTERVLLITPARDEIEHLEQVADGLLAQTRPPDVWLVVDDNSADGTTELLAALGERVSFLRTVHTPPGYTDVGDDRNAAGGPDRAFNFGLEHVDLADFTKLGKLDADIVLPPDFIESMLARFAAEPELGAAGGAVTEPRAGEWVLMKTPLDHPTPQSRIYTRECFEAIGGMPARMGADVITTMRAKMLGYTTRTFLDLPVQHLRPMATADGVRRGRRRQGEYQYIVHYYPLWMLARAAVVAVRFQPRGLSGLWFLEGYVRAILGPVQPVDDPALRAFVRREQRMRVRRAIARRIGRRAPAPALAGDAAGGVAATRAAR